MDVLFKAIGVIHTPLKGKEEAPIQSSRSNVAGSVELFREYLDGLEGIEEFSHIYLLFGFHRSDQKVSLKITPFLDDQVHGLFSTRYPCRPNPIGLSVVRLIERKENVLYCQGVDMLDGTPLFDIKPYIPEFDVFEVEKIGWYRRKKYP